MTTSTEVLIKAVSAGRARQVRLLLDSKINVELTDDCGETALIRALFIEHTRNREIISRLLLRYGAKVSHSDVVGRNALQWACIYGRETEVKLMLTYADVDLDLNQVDINGQTALFHAATFGSAAVVKTLVDALKKYDLSVDVMDFSGVSPLMQALRLGHDVCASILINQGSATVGLNMVNDEDFEIADKWAVASSIGRMKTSRPQFPPIISQATAQKIKYRENRAMQLQIAVNRMNYTVDSDDEESTYGSEVSYYTEKSFDGINLMTDPFTVQDSIAPESPSLRLESTTSSMDAVAGSGSEEDRENCKPCPCKVQSEFKPSQDLPKLYHIYEEQNCVSFRPPAARPESVVQDGEAETISDSEIGSAESTPRRSKGTHPKSGLRRDALKRSINKAKLQDSLSPVAPTKFPVVTSPSADVDRSPRLKPVLPQIAKTGFLVHLNNQLISSTSNGKHVNPAKEMNEEDDTKNVFQKNYFEI